MFLKICGVGGGFPEVWGIILTTTRLDMMVSGFIFDDFLMIEVWKSDFFADLDRWKRLSNEGPLPWRVVDVWYPPSTWFSQGLTAGNLHFMIVVGDPGSPNDLNHHNATFCIVMHLVSWNGSFLWCFRSLGGPGSSKSTIKWRVPAIRPCKNQVLGGYQTSTTPHGRDPPFDSSFERSKSVKKSDFQTSIIKNTAKMQPDTII